jgi:hypothetical protein
MIKYSVLNLAVPGAILTTVWANNKDEAQAEAERQYPAHAVNHGVRVVEADEA